MSSACQVTVEPPFPRRSRSLPFGRSSSSGRRSPSRRYSCNGGAPSRARWSPPDNSL
jgi:hypothetical protein